MKTVLSLLALILLVSCAAPTVTDGNGYVYRKIRSASGYDVELWERIKPPSSNYVYTPSLKYILHPDTPEFKSILR